MNRQVLIGASLACADFRFLENEIRALEEGGVDYIHVDIMDGKFVPNFGLNLDFIRMVKDLTPLPIITHLMIVEPERYIPTFSHIGSQAILIHAEASVHLQRALSMIRESNVRTGIALNPATPLNVLDYLLEDLDIILIMTVNPGFAGQTLVPATIQKIAQLRSLLQKKNLNIDIEVDGNVSFENIPSMVRSGATMLVGGTSSIFKKGIEKSIAIQEMRRLASESILES